MTTSTENVLRLVPPEAEAAPAPEGIALGVVLARDGERFRIRSGRRELLAGCDPSVDPALVEEAMATGARVVLEGDLIVGALAVARSLAIGRDGAVEAQVKRLALTAEQSALLRTRSSFLRLEDSEIELYGARILTRARELVRFLARMIKLN